MQTWLRKNFYLQYVAIPFLYAKIYFMGLLRFYISPEKVRDYLQGKSKFFAQLMAIALGGVTPFCSCSKCQPICQRFKHYLPLHLVYFSWCLIFVNLFCIRFVRMLVWL
jgi:uncharacterized membrane protein YraQ (UPF0718 family)